MNFPYFLWLRFVASEDYLIKHGRWCERTGEPVNAAARCFDARDAKAPSNAEVKPS